MRKVLIAGVLGGIVGFVWGAVSHTVLPLGEAGVDTIPDEELVLAAMQVRLSSGGFYIFPGEGHDASPKSPEHAAWEERYRKGPRGVLVYQPQGSAGMSPLQLLYELLSNIAGSLVAAWLLLRVTGSYGGRVLAMTSLGVFAWLATSASYWIWYGFPADFSLAQLLDGVVQWFLVGLLAAKIVGPRPAPA
jgi:hypothetical protein